MGSTLKTHIKFVHDQQKILKCDICSSRFVQSGDLKRHINNVHMENHPLLLEA